MGSRVGEGGKVERKRQEGRISTCNTCPFDLLNAFDIPPVVVRIQYICIPKFPLTTVAKR